MQQLQIAQRHILLSNIERRNRHRITIQPWPRRLRPTVAGELSKLVVERLPPFFVVDRWVRQFAYPLRLAKRRTATPPERRCVTRIEPLQARKALKDGPNIIRREFSDASGAARALSGLGMVAYDQGDFAASRALYRESLAIQRTLSDRSAVAISLEGLAEAMAALDDVARAAQLWGRRSGCVRTPAPRCGPRGGTIATRA